MLRVHKDAFGDLQEIRAHSEADYVALIAFIEQLKADEQLMKRLLDHNYGSGGTDVISVSKWLDVQKFDKVPIWRLKAWDLIDQGMNFRFIYGYYWRNKTFNILAVVHRGSLDYDDPSHPIRLRVLQTFKRIFPDG